jgi:hypothetical protein
MAQPNVVKLAFHNKGKPTGLPEPGTTEHALLILLAIELGALVLLRRYFRSAHGG